MEHATTTRLLDQESFLPEKQDQLLTHHNLTSLDSLLKTLISYELVLVKVRGKNQTIAIAEKHSKKISDYVTN